MLDWRGPIALALLLAALALAPVAQAAEAEPEPPSGQTRAEDIPSPGGLLMPASNGYTLIVNTTGASGSTGARVRVELSDHRGAVHYSAPANLADEGIKANLGRFGRIELRWVPDGHVREVIGKCRDYKTHFYFATGHYVGRLQFRGGNGFSEALATHVTWQRRWYGKTFGCQFHISEGFPGPGAILYAGGVKGVGRPTFTMIDNGSGQEIQYSAAQDEQIGQIDVTRDAYGYGRPETLQLLHGFRSAEINPPAPFSGSARFSRSEHAHGTWLGDLSVDFPDRSGVHLAGKSFEAIFHSGFHEEGLGFSAR